MLQLTLLIAARALAISWSDSCLITGTAASTLLMRFVLGGFGLLIGGTSTQNTCRFLGRGFD